MLYDVFDPRDRDRPLGPPLPRLLPRKRRERPARLPPRSRHLFRRHFPTEQRRCPNDPPGPLSVRGGRKPRRGHGRQGTSRSPRPDPHPDGSVPGHDPWQPLYRSVTNPKTEDEGRARSVSHDARHPHRPRGRQGLLPGRRLRKSPRPQPQNRRACPRRPGAGGQRLQGLPALLAAHRRRLRRHQIARPEHPPRLPRPLPPERGDAQAYPLRGNRPHRFQRQAHPLRQTLWRARSPGSKTITFRIGALGAPVFQEDSPIHEYWKHAFDRERFAESSDDPESASPNRGTCLVTGQENQPIADVHRTLIKGIPGLPPIGGYLVSFDSSTTCSPPSASSGLERPGLRERRRRLRPRPQSHPRQRPLPPVLRRRRARLLGRSRSGSNRRYQQVFSRRHPL